MAVQIRRTYDDELIDSLHERIFPSDEAPRQWDAAWIAYEDDSPVGFATVKVADEGSSAFLQRAGVSSSARGAGLQRRLIRVREQWARRQGIKAMLTYTTYENHASISNLLKSGYRFYTPAWHWAGPDVHYYQKRL